MEGREGRPVSSPPANQWDGGKAPTKPRSTIRGNPRERTGLGHVWAGGRSKGPTRNRHKTRAGGPRCVWANLCPRPPHPPPHTHTIPHPAASCCIVPGVYLLLELGELVGVGADRERGGGFTVPAPPPACWVDPTRAAFYHPAKPVLPPPSSPPTGKLITLAPAPNCVARPPGLAHPLLFSAH